MALVKKIIKLERNARLQTEADCTYNISISGGKKYLQSIHMVPKSESM